MAVSGMDLHEVQKRRAICLAAIQAAVELGATPQVVNGYRAQLEALDKRIEELTGKPPPVVVGLKTARLFGKSDSKGE